MSHMVMYMYNAQGGECIYMYMREGRRGKEGGMGGRSKGGREGKGWKERYEYQN